VAAAFGFIHVMGSHKKSNAVAGKFKQQIPQLPPRDGIDSRVGSSKKSNFGWCSIAQQSASRCFHPPESCAASRSKYCSSPFS